MEVRNILIGMIFFFVTHAQSNQSEKKHFVFVVASYNNAAWCEKNITSILTQEYDNFSVIFIDDCSTDDTLALVESCITAHPMQDRCVIIHNEQRQGALANIYHAVHQCAATDIIVIVDGDDWLAHTKVLAQLNLLYQNPDVWITYGQYKTYPGNHWGICRPFDERVVATNAYRRSNWISSHVRTFYAGLFHHIKREDLMYQNQFFPVVADLATMIPMLEMAAGRCAFCSDWLYVYNDSNPINDFRAHFQKIGFFERYVRSLPPYAPLASLTFS